MNEPKKEIKTKNLSITLSLEEYHNMDYLVEYFQKQSISTVTRTDVVKFMIKQMKLSIELGETEIIEKAMEA